MNIAQRRRTIELLGEGATLRECAALVHCPWPQFSKYWTRGRRDQGGTRSAAAKFYRGRLGDEGAVPP